MSEIKTKGRFWRKIQDLLIGGLGIQFGKVIVNITYSEDGRSVIAHFTHGTNDTGCLLVGTDGPILPFVRSSLGLSTLK